MSVYFNKKRKWWEYYFRYKKQPYTRAGFQRKKDALAAEAERKKEIKKPKRTQEETDMAFLTLLNRRLDHLQAYRSNKHYQDNLYMAKRWINQWKDKLNHQMTPQVISKYLIALRKKVSAHTANKELRALRALWNFGIKPPNRWLVDNPTDGIEFFPTESKAKYVPPTEDVIRVILVAKGEVQDYLWTIALTMGRMSEINRMECKDVDFNNNIVTLYTRKSKGGHLTPRTIPMAKTLNKILKKRLKGNNTQWVFNHTYYSRKTEKWVTGPYKERKRIMKTLCKKAGVQYFRFHPLRHFGASVLLKEGVDPKTIQNLLGHANFKTTEIYLHSFKDSDRNAIDKLELTLNKVERCL